MEKRYNVGLDGIRVFAIAAVLLVHLAMYLPIPEKAQPLFSWGAAGVQLFFVLSGYLACCSFEREKSAGQYYKKESDSHSSCLFYCNNLCRDFSPTSFRGCDS